MYNNSTGVLTPPITGKWRLVWNLCANMTASGQWIQAIFAGGVSAQVTAHSSSGNPLTCPLVITNSLTAGTTVTLQANASTTLGMSVVVFGVVRAWFTAEYVGT
jgi:hypothetical protein